MDLCLLRKSSLCYPSKSEMRDTASPGNFESGQFFMITILFPFHSQMRRKRGGVEEVPRRKRGGTEEEGRSKGEACRACARFIREVSSAC